jgi:hypothetical protein
MLVLSANYSTETVVAGKRSRWMTRRSFGVSCRKEPMRNKQPTNKKPPNQSHSPNLNTLNPNRLSLNPNRPTMLSTRTYRRTYRRTPRRTTHRSNRLQQRPGHGYGELPEPAYTLDATRWKAHRLLETSMMVPCGNAD